MKMAEHFPKRVENTVGKGGIDDYQSKILSFGKELTLYPTAKFYTGPKLKAFADDNID